MSSESKETYWIYNGIKIDNTIESVPHFDRVNSIYKPGNRMSFVYAICKPYSKEEYIKKFCYLRSDEIWFKPLEKGLSLKEKSKFKENENH